MRDVVAAVPDPEGDGMREDNTSVADYYQLSQLQRLADETIQRPKW